jgi:hypothetical protein
LPLHILERRRQVIDLIGCTRKKVVENGTWCRTRVAEFAAELSRQTGHSIPYRNLPVAEYANVLAGFGLPPALAEAIAAWDFEASRGVLFDDGKVLSRLIGRPTTPLAQMIAAALKAA